MSANVILALEAVSLALDVLQTLGRLVPGQGRVAGRGIEDGGVWRQV